jgi:hypothetical protein
VASAAGGEALARLESGLPAGGRSGYTSELAAGRLVAVSGMTRIVFSEGLVLIVDEEIENVRSALTQYEGGQAFPEFKSASGEDVCVASARVAYIERASKESEQPHTVD